MAESAKLTDGEKIVKIKEYKEKGNELYREGNYRKASQSYYRSILFIKGLSAYSGDIGTGIQSLMSIDGTRCKKPTDLDADTKALICDCYNNLAACLLKQPEPKFDRVIEHCDKALEVMPLNIKAHFRKGSSQYALGHFDEALATLEKAGSDGRIRKLMDQCRIQIKKQDKELAVRYKAMFKS